MDPQHNSPTSPLNRINERHALWGTASFILAIIMCSFNTSALVLGASFGAKIVAVLAGTPLGLIGSLIGDAIRKFARPDFIVTTGGTTSLIWLKLFWAIGPQIIGLVIGVSLGVALVLSL